MSNEEEGWPSYLMKAMDAQGIYNAADLSRESGIDQTQISRWLRGIGQPSIDNLRKLAPVLRRPLLELMVRAGHVSPVEARLSDIKEPVAKAAPDTVTAIEEDPELIEEARAHLLNQYDILRRFSSGVGGSKTTRPLRAVARKRPKRGPEQ